MSYDIRFTRGKDNFSAWLLQNGGVKHGENTFGSPKEVPVSVGFWIEGEMLQFNYLRNHYAVFYAYLLLFRAQKASIDFEIEDLQSGKIFSLASPIDPASIDEAISSYLAINQGMYSESINKNGYYVNGAGPNVPIQSRELEFMSRDLFLQEAYNRAAPDAGYIPKPFTFVNLERKQIQKMFVWSEFIDQAFPSEYTIDFVQVLFDVSDEQKRRTYIVSWEYLKSILPPAEDVEVQQRKRIWYRNLFEKRNELEVLLAGHTMELPPIKDWKLDSTLATLFSVLEVLPQINSSQPESA